MYELLVSRMLMTCSKLSAHELLVSQMLMTHWLLQLLVVTSNCW